MYSFRGTPHGLIIVDPRGKARLRGFLHHGASSTKRRDHYVTELRRLLPRLGARRCLAQGASLPDPTERSRHLFIVERGLIEVTLPEDRKRLPVASLHPGASFIIDVGWHRIAQIEAAADSCVVDLPFARLRTLCPDEADFRLLLQQVRALDLKAFLGACYPAEGRLRLIRNGDE